MTTDRAALNQLLDETLIGYIAVDLGEGPVVTPVSYARDGDRILFHGSTGSRRMRALADGARLGMTVAAVDALAVGRSANGTGMKYRSASIFGVCEKLSDEQKETALERYLNRYLPNRTQEVRPMTGKEIAATMVLALPISDWSMRVSQGFPTDPPEDVAGEAWAGLVPIRVVAGEPVPNPDLRPGIDLPSSVMSLLPG